MRLGMRSGLVAAAMLLWSVPAGATDIPIPGKLLLIKEGRVKFISKPAGQFVLPPANGPTDPTMNPSSINVFQQFGSLTDTLTGGILEGLGNPPGSPGYKYKNLSAPSGGAVKLILMKPTIIKILAKDDAPLAGSVGPDVGVGVNIQSQWRC